VTAIDVSDYDSLAALAGSGLSFRFHFTSNLNATTATTGVNLSAAVVAGSYTGGLDNNLLLTAQNNVAAMSTLVNPPTNTSASTSIKVTMVAQVTFDGVNWYDIGSDTLKAFLSKK